MEATYGLASELLEASKLLRTYDNRRQCVRQCYRFGSGTEDTRNKKDAFARKNAKRGPDGWEGVTKIE